MYSDLQRLEDLNRAEATFEAAGSIADIKAGLLLLCRTMKHSAAETVADTDRMLGITRPGSNGAVS